MENIKVTCAEGRNILLNVLASLAMLQTFQHLLVHTVHNPMN